MDANEHKAYRSLTARRDAERRYAGPPVDNEGSRPQPKSYSSSETLKAFDQDARLAYGGLVKELVHQEADEFGRPGTDFSLRELNFGDTTPPHVMGYRVDPSLPHRGYALGASSDVDAETDGMASPEHAVRLWRRSSKSARSSCLSSRANSNLTLTDTEHENAENDGTFPGHPRLRTPPTSHSHTPSQHHMASANSLTRGNYTPRSNSSPTPTDGSVPPDGPASVQESGSAQDNWLLNSNIPLETRHFLFKPGGTSPMYCSTTPNYPLTSSTVYSPPPRPLPRSAFSRPAFSLKKPYQYCTWKCAALSAILVSTMLVFLLAYFIGV